MEQVAERLMFSMSKLSRMETGRSVATPRDVRDLCDLYSKPKGSADFLAKLLTLTG